MQRMVKAAPILAFALVMPITAWADGKKPSTKDTVEVKCIVCVNFSVNGEPDTSKCVRVSCDKPLTAKVPASMPVGSACTFQRGGVVARQGKITPAHTCESATPTLAR